MQKLHHFWQLFPVWFLLYLGIVELSNNNSSVHSFVCLGAFWSLSIDPWPCHFAFCPDSGGANKCAFRCMFSWVPWFQNMQDRNLIGNFRRVIPGANPGGTNLKGWFLWTSPVGSMPHDICNLVLCFCIFCSAARCLWAVVLLNALHVTSFW